MNWWDAENFHKIICWINFPGDTYKLPGVEAASRWRHQLETFSTLLALCEGKPPVTGGFPSQRIVTRGFDVFFDIRLNKLLSKQSRRRWFERPSCPLSRHCNTMTLVGSLAPGNKALNTVRCRYNADNLLPNQCIDPFLVTLPWSGINVKRQFSYNSKVRCETTYFLGIKQRYKSGVTIEKLYLATSSLLQISIHLVDGT